MSAGLNEFSVDCFSRNHSRAAQNLSAAFDSVSDRFDIYQRLTLNLAGWVVTPDLCLFEKGKLSLDWLSDEEVVDIPPAAIIEIMSPQDSVQPLIEKFREYLGNGVKSCWLVEPPVRVVSVFPCTGGSRSFPNGYVHDEVLNISIPLSRIFH